MPSLFIISLFSLFLAVQSLVIEQKSCVSPDVVAIAQQVSSPHYFCAWYLSDGRTKSPIPNINTNALLNACKCIASAEPVGTKAKTLDAIAKSARLHSYVSATCLSTSGNPIRKEFQNPLLFCTFFNSYERHDSPIPNLNVPAVKHACNCVISGPKSSSKTSSTPKASSSSVKRTTSLKSSSSSTKKSSSKTSSTVISRTSNKSTVQASSKPSQHGPSSRTQIPSSKTSTKPATIKTSSGKSSSSKLSSSKLFSSKPSSSKPISSDPNTNKPSSKLSSNTILSSTKISSSQTSSSKSSSSQSPSVRSTASSLPSPNASLKSSSSASSSTRSKPSVTSASSTSLSTSSSTSSSISQPTPELNFNSPCGDQPAGSTWTNGTDPWKLYCKSYDIDGLQYADIYTGMWSAMEYCDATGCTGVKCNSNGGFCRTYYGPLKLIPSSTWSVALRINADAYDVITSQQLEPFCTTYLGYTTPFITEMATVFANTTKTALFNLTATSTVVALSTETKVAGIVTVTSMINASAIVAPVKKRRLETPYLLGPYGDSAVSSGCSRVATKPAPTTFFETVTIASNETVATTATAIAYKNITSVVTELATLTTTTTLTYSSSATCTPTPIVDAEQQAKDLAALDFLFTHNNVVAMLSSFPMSILETRPVTGDVLVPIQTALQNWVPCTSSHNVTAKLLACKDSTASMDFAACIIFRTSPYVHPPRFSDQYSSPPTAAIAKSYTTYEPTTVGVDGVSISPDMSLIEVIDHATTGGRWGSKNFRNLLYYFGEYDNLR